jgi:DNA-directed RNA polymerase specialized sigma24 family protein
MATMLRPLVSTSSRFAQPKPGLFPETDWWLISQASVPGEVGRAALERLVVRYQHAIRFLVQRRGPVMTMTADDLYQEFLLHLATPTAKGTSRLASYDPVQGRFRNWLSRMLQNKISNVKRKTLGQSMGLLKTDYPGDDQMPDSSSASDFPVALPQDLEDDIALSEAYSYCFQAIERVREVEPEARFAALRRYLPGSPEPEDREKTAAELDMNPNTLTKSISRLRQRFVSELSKVVAERFGCKLPDPGLDAKVRKERDRIIHLLQGHEWAPREVGV